MMKPEIILAYNEGASVPFAMFDVDRASRDYGTGRVELFKDGQLVDVITLTPSQFIFVAPINVPSLHGEVESATEQVRNSRIVDTLIRS
jgi:hypothetical protein